MTLYDSLDLKNEEKITWSDMARRQIQAKPEKSGLLAVLVKIDHVATI